MYSTQQLIKGIKKSINNPRFAIRELNRIYYSLYFGKNYNEQGKDILSKDWDTLIILDGCRYDMFKQQSELPGNLSKVVSRGSHTSQYLYGNFADQKLHDTVYTTASPQLEKYADNINVEFYAVDNVWDSENWNSDVGTVRPETMTEIAVKNINQYPNKKHIIHYMQPHFPFIGSDIANVGRGIKESANSKAIDLWELAFNNSANFTKQEIWNAYRSNLELVLQSVEELLSNELGKTVVTSDHGNMVGERSSPLPIKEWGHPPRLYTSELVTVPWLEIEGSTRKDIIAEEPQEVAKTTNNVQDRLEHLGYV